MEPKAIIFDLDGVLTDTAEYHYLAWKRLADEEGLPFDRTMNERLRGISRRNSLEIILDGGDVSEERIAEMMARKNTYYVAMLQQITPENLLPGALKLLQELKTAGVKIAIGSASKNARTVLERLGILPLLDAIADGHSVIHPKPAPDLFLAAAQAMAEAPATCAVIEDAAAGIDAALAAGMWAIGLGPEERVGHAHARFESLDGVNLRHITAALTQASWMVAESCFEPGRRHYKETIFTIGNGYQCVRGAGEEGWPQGHAAGFVHRLWDWTPLHFSELANIPRWWGVDLWANGRHFRLDQGKVLSYHRQLDLHRGLLSRHVRWQVAAEGPVLDLQFERFVCMHDAHTAAMRLTVKVVKGETELRVRSGLDAYAHNPIAGAPVPDMGLWHWRIIDQQQSPDLVQLHVRTRETNIDLALAANVRVRIMGDTPPFMSASVCAAEGQPGIEHLAMLEAGDSLVLDKFVGVASAFEAAAPPAAAASAAQDAGEKGYEALFMAHTEAWAKIWEVNDVVIEGDIEAQIDMRFNIFQLLIAAPRFSDRASIGAKTLSGFGYRHHVFWDNEIFMLPMFSHTQPRLARHMLLYRYHNLSGARAKAAENGYEGAQFPWESAGDGKEVTPTWVPHFADPRKLIRIYTGDIEIHITADIAYGTMQYWRVSGDDRWMRDYGAEMVLDGAKFWASAAQQEEDGRYHFRDVIGPDEYHDHVDDNAFTNFLARWHLQTASTVSAWLQDAFPAKHAELCVTLDLTPGRLAHWREVSGRIYLPQDPETGLIEQFAGYYDLQAPDFALLRDPGRTRSMQAILDIEGCQATQIIKQPDVLMLQYLFPGHFSDQQVRTNYDYYDPRTDHEHGSSLGPAISAIMACRVGKPDDAYQHFMRAARADLQDIRHNAGDGIHGASAGGLWQAAVFGFGGLRLGPEDWSVEPCLPAHWTRISFKFLYRGALQTVDIRPQGRTTTSTSKYRVVP